MTEQRKGEVIVLSQTFIWGFFPIITILTYAKLSGLASLGWSIVFAALFFGAILIARKKVKELANLQLWKYAIAIAFFNGVMYYGLVFIGLTKTTAGNSSIVALFEILTSFIFFHLIRKDIISKEHTFGAGLMVLGAMIVLWPNFSHFNIGDILILAATFFTPMGNFAQQKARKIASSESILFARSILTFPIVFGLSALLGQHASSADVRSSLVFLLINGAIIFGISKIMWLEAIHRIAVTKALALGSVSPLVTLIFAWLLLKQTPNAWQLASLVPMIFGIFLLTDQLKLRGFKLELKNGSNFVP
jgi:drug/metabolite transporter (DMT)-like permease